MTTPHTRETYHFVNGVKISGGPYTVCGNPTYVYGDLTGISGKDCRHGR